MRPNHHLPGLAWWAMAGSLMAVETTGAAPPQSGEPAAQEVELETPVGDSSTQRGAVDMGGAVRFTYFWQDFDAAVKTRRGSAGLDIFRVSADGTLQGLTVSAEYRFYPYMNAIHHGWVGYPLHGGQLQAGITKVPFGLLPYAAHNAWFGIPFYVGLADDYDLGIKYVKETAGNDIQLAFFKNGELGDAGNLNRYSYDVVADGAAANEESNAVHVRLARTVGYGSPCEVELGASAAAGQLYNGDRDANGSRWAAAGHLDSRCGRWNWQLELVRYRHDPAHPAGVAEDVVTLGAFSGSYDIAADGILGVANAAYNLPLRIPGVDLITCYNDFSVLRKDQAQFDNSYLNTTGCVLASGPTFVYLDVINAHNMVFFDGGSLAGGGDSGIETRLNINLGYYW